MPCYDEWNPPLGSIKPIYQDNPRMVAMLCAVLTCIEKGPVYNLEHLLKSIDWREAGITRKDIENWWMDHKRQDRRRRKMEQERVRKEIVRKTALQKLTAEEKKLLGLK